MRLYTSLVPRPPPAFSNSKLRIRLGMRLAIYHSYSGGGGKG